MNDYMSEFKKSIEKIPGITTSNDPPRYWFSTGNFVLNRVLSGSFYKGIPQGRITSLCGPSAAGKSFLAGNIIKSAQADGAVVLVIDSENALDKDFLSAIGIDTDNGLHYVGVTTISHVTSVVSNFIKRYKDEVGDDLDAPKVLIVIDSLDMLMTDTELEKYEKGQTHSDQGQHPKQLKQMLRTISNDIKSLNVSVIVTKQVYRASQQQILQGDGLLIINDAIRYSASLICLLTKLKLRDEDKNVSGIRMKCEGFKTRFTKPFQSVTIEVPYEEGMNPLSGLLEVALGLDVLQKRGHRYVFLANSENEVAFFAKDIADVADSIIKSCEEKQKSFLSSIVEEEDEEDVPIKSRKKQKINENKQ